MIGNIVRSVAFLIVTTAAVVACANETSSGDEKMATTPNTSIEQLEKTIQLTFRPVSVQWQVATTVPQKDDEFAFGPTDYTLIAVVEFRESDYEKVLAEAPIQLPAQLLTLTDHHVYEWLPEDIKAVVRGKSSGSASSRDYLLRNGEQFTKSPYLSSYAAQLDDQNKLVIVMSTR